MGRVKLQKSTCWFAGVTLVISLNEDACVMFREALGRASVRPRDEVEKMSSKVSTGLIVMGGLLMALALCFLPAAFHDRSDANTLELGLCLFSAGSLTGSLGIYFKARALKGGILPEKAGSEATAKRKLRGGCDLCGTEAPAVLCTVHQVEVCGPCLAQHYDQRSCAYVPSRRAAAGKNAKNLARAKGA